MKAYRLVKERYASSALDGEGARLFGGRWNSKGTRVVYLSDSPALAALEVLVHTRSEEDLQDYLILELAFDEALVEVIAPENLPGDWHQPKYPSRHKQLATAGLVKVVASSLGFLAPSFPSSSTSSSTLCTWI